MSLYDWFMKPLENSGIRIARSRLIPKAKGNVLEIGAGTGANIVHYDMPNIDNLILTDKVLSKTIKRTELNNTTIKEIDVMNLPFEDNTFDTIVHTLVFCSVPNVEKGLLEMKRVLKDTGKIIFIEHVLPEKRFLKRSFKMINPLWKRVASGCNLTRDYLSSITSIGFKVTESNRFMRTVFISGIAYKNDN